MKYPIRTVFTGLVLACHSVFAWTGGTHETNWNQLVSDVATSEAQLQILMDQAGAAGMDTNYAYVSQVTINRFQTYAQYDRDHTDLLTDEFTNLWWHTKVPDQDYPVNLPFDEMQSCLEVASNAIAELEAQLATHIVLQPPVDFSTGIMTFGNGSALRNGEPAFPSDFTWMPNDEDLLLAFGRMGGTYYALPDLNSDSSIKSWALTSDINSVTDQTARNIAFGQYFIGHSGVPSWMSSAHPEVFDGGRNFVKYDTDSPYIRSGFADLFQNYLPPVCTAQGDQPRMHLLANEPNFATRKGGWQADNGVSANTMDRYKYWLTTKYSAVSNLNATYGTAYADFNAAQAAMVMPIDPAASSTIQGGPVWYDWCRFNMYRVNDFFQMLKDGSQGNDPHAAPTTIKILGGQLSNSWRDDGMDMEYLANLMDVTGADCHTAPMGLTKINNKFDTTWQDDYALEWIDQSMLMDFYKSLYPDKPYYDSEWHGFDTGKWRDFSMGRNYVRTAIWLGFSHGMNCIQSWVWGRENDGSFADVNATLPGAVLTQPTALDAYGRVMKELNAHAKDVTALVKQDRDVLVFYCSDAAIQDLTYVEEMEKVYESLKLLNYRVGFTTPVDIISRVTSNQTVVVSPTAFISDATYASLDTFCQAGGNVVLVNGATFSFAKNELGFPTSGNTNVVPFAQVDYDSESSNMADDLGAVLSALLPSPPVELSITDAAAQAAYGVLNKQSYDSASERTVISLINVSKDQRMVALSPGDYIDQITGQPVSNVHVMEPYDVLLLKTGNEITPPPAISEVIQWGEIGGDTGIVTNTQDFSVKNTTYVPDVAANPAIGPGYYNNAINRSPAFNMANSSASNSKQVVNASSGDLLRAGKNQATIDTMYVWENSLTGNAILTSLSAEVRFSMYGGTGAGAVRWIVQKGTDEWYASAGIGLTQYHANSSTFTTLSVSNPAELDWFEFTPITRGFGAIGAASGIDMTNIKSVGLYYDLSGSGANIYADLRYFKVMASSGEPASGWDTFISFYGLSGDPLDDFDEDGWLDVYEYGLGGNPTNPMVQGIAPSIQYHPDHQVSFFNLELTNQNPGITYVQEWTDNLVSNDWNSTWNSTNHIPSASPGYDDAERMIYGGTNDQLFFRLNISQP